MKNGSLTLEDLQIPWAIRPETLTVITRVLSGALSHDEASAELGVGAAIGQETVTTSGAVAVIPLRGLITPRGSFLSLLFGGGAGGLQGFRAMLRDAVADDDIAAVLIDIDSPGGRVDLVAETASEIRALRGKKPIVALSNTMAASAAYWIAAQADELVVTPSGEVGSIGVFVVHEDWSKFNADFGVQPTYVSAGKYKTEGNPDEPLSEDARADLQAMVDDYYAMFVDDVATGRSVTADAVRGGFGEGRLVRARNAVTEGMADRVETFEQTVSRLAAGAREPRQSGGALQLERAGASAQEPQSDDDNPEPNSAEDDEARARFARLVADQPMHL